MSGKTSSRSVTTAACLVFGASLAGTGVSDATENPFSMKPLSTGPVLLAEGKCGEGRCGMRRMDANDDGKVTREEFMQGHEAMFDSMDANGDGVIDADERHGHGKHGKCRMKEGS